MSRRRDKRSGRQRAPEGGQAEGGPGGTPQSEPRRSSGDTPDRLSAWVPGAPAPYRQPPRLSFVAQVGVLVAVFAIVSLIADLAGAANLGVALGIGSIAFAIALVAMIVKN